MLVIVERGNRREVRLIPEPTPIGRLCVRYQRQIPDRDMTRIQTALLKHKTRHKNA